ncbi:24387_t:CDS:1, partial [Racocetra persica]
KPEPEFNVWTSNNDMIDIIIRRTQTNNKVICLEWIESKDLVNIQYLEDEGFYPSIKQHGLTDILA